MLKHSQAVFLQEMKLGGFRYTSEYKAQSVTWKHSHSSAKNFKTGQPPGKVGWTAALVLQDGRQRNTHPMQPYFREVLVTEMKLYGVAIALMVCRRKEGK